MRVPIGVPNKKRFEIEFRGVVWGDLPWENEGKGGGGGEGEGVGSGPAKEPASQCARVCQNYPLAIHKGQKEHIHFSTKLSGPRPRPSILSEDTMGGGKKRGRKTSRMTPSPKGVLDPPSYGTFSTPLRCQCSVFPVQKSTTEQLFWRGPKELGERVLWYVCLPPYVLHPPISRPNFGPPKKFMCLISLERMQKGDPHQLFSGGFWGVKKGSQPRHFRPQKV